MKKHNLKFTHKTFELILNTVYITSFIYIFSFVGYTIVTQMQLMSERVDGIGVMDFLHINKTTTFIQCKYKLKWIIIQITK